MYQKYFGLEKNPFALTPDPNFLYLTSAHREALAGLLFAITCRKGFLVLTGDAGTGKTTLLRTMLRRVSPTRTLFSFVVHPTLTPAEFLEYTLLDFGITDIPSSKAQRLVLFHQFLVRSCEQGKIPVLVVDEAQKLSPELLEEIRLLTNAETAEHKLLQIILAGQNELSDVLARDDMRQLRQRIAVRVTVGALSLSDVSQYIQTRWVRAGSAAPLPFTKEAIAAITHYSRGIPRVINAICDASLVSAFAAGKRAIEVGQIESVAKDLRLLPTNGDSKRIASDTQTQEVTASGTPALTVPTAPVQILDRYMPAAPKRPRLMRWATRLGLGGA